jgi:hypothetical protein
MRRRDFIKVVVGSAVTLPAAARAPVVGFLSSRSPAESELDVAGFRQVCPKVDTSKIRMWRSNIAGQKINTTGYQR